LLPADYLIEIKDVPKSCGSGARSLLEIYSAFSASRFTAGAFGSAGDLPGAAHLAYDRTR